MRVFPTTVQNFPLTIEKVSSDFIRFPGNITKNLYHYTSRSGLEGILRSGGLRATYRMRMNDSGEFRYAKELIYGVLDEMAQCTEFPKVVHSICSYVSINLQQFLQDTIDKARAYCACFSVHSDSPGQWKTYAGKGQGLALGFNFQYLLNEQVQRKKKIRPYVFVAPVHYDEQEQKSLVRNLIMAGIDDLQRFAQSCSSQSEPLTALRDRITQEIVVYLFCLIDFIKAKNYTMEGEVRLILDANDGTLNAPNVQYLERQGESIPYLFLDLQTSTTGRLPLAEIRVGPKADYAEELRFLNLLLNDLSYGSGDYPDRPRLVRSGVSFLTS